MSESFTIVRYIERHRTVASLLNIEEISEAIELIRSTLYAGGLVMTCGNGGSASTSSHFITDWNKMTNVLTSRSFRGICLNDNIGLVTAYANDFSYEDCFKGQVTNLAREGDLLIGVSVSGRSKNVVNAILEARSIGCKTIGLVGYDGGDLATLCDKTVWVRSHDMQICEDIHLMFGHMVMKALCNAEISA